LSIRSLRLGFTHGAYCLGACWALMAVLIAVGVMNVPAMVGLAAFIQAEKIWARGPAAGRLAGLAVLGLAVATIWFPGLAPGLHATHMVTVGS
jgi:predicted metal-binding membrane protein